MKKLIFILLCFPLFVAAESYTDVGGAAQMVADSFNELYTYVFEDVPSFFERAVAYFVIWAVKAKLFIQIETIKFSWAVAKVIIADLNIMSQITAKISLLPVDVRQALVEMRLFDGLNILLNAYIARFVMEMFN